MRLLIFDGDSAAGKSALCSYLVANGWSYLGKYIDRPLRPEETYANSFVDYKRVSGRKVSKDYFEKNKGNSDFISYNYGKHNYGFFLSELEDVLQNFHDVCMVVRNFQTIEYLKNYFENRSEVTIIFTYVNKELASRRLVDIGYSLSDAQERVNRKPNCFDHYAKNSSFYSGVVINEDSFDQTITSLKTFI